MVNVENVRKLLDALKALPPEQFNMAEVDCGTACCLMGLSRRIGGVDDPAGSPSEFRRFLGLESFVDANDLSVPSGEMAGRERDYVHGPRDFPHAAGVRVLEILADSGKVDWNQALLDVGAP